MTELSQIIALAEQRLKNAEIKTFKLDVRLIFCFSFKISQEEFFLNRDQISINPEKLDFFQDNIKKRQKRQPISHIIGNKHFFNDIFDVNNHVLTPRPDSEILIETIIKKYPNKLKKLRFLEIGVGSGCLILTLLKFFQNSTSVAVDISQEAIKVAKKNAKNLQVENRIEILKSNLFTKIKKTKKFDIIISNPPYIPSADIKNLQDEVKKFEPILALDGGKDGLDFYRNIASQAKEFLTKDGLIVLEIGQGQEIDVIKIFQQYGFFIEQQQRDLSRIVRCLVIGG